MPRFWRFADADDASDHGDLALRNATRWYRIDRPAGAKKPTPEVS